MGTERRSLRATLVGRQAELFRLHASLNSLAAGAGGCLLIAGEPGIGKSALARCAAEAASDLNLETCWGHTWEAGGAPAYWPWMELFQNLLDSRPGLGSDVLSSVLDLADIPKKGPELEPDQARFRFYAAVRSLLADATRDRPCLLILEDLHAADADSLNLFLFLSRQVHQLPVLLVGTFREIEARSRAAAAPLWDAARHAELLRPGRLEPDAVARYVAERTGRAPERDMLNALNRVTEGNPLFLSELLGLLDPTQPLSSRLPASVGAVIRQQVDRLPDHTADLLPAAAVLGRSFALAELASLTQRPPGDLQDGLAVAVEAGFLEQEGVDRYRFYHALCMDALLQKLDARTRERLHARHARYLEVEVAAGRSDLTPALASHLAQAGLRHRAPAVEAWRSAARQARGRLAYDEAAQALARALDCFSEGPQFPPEDRARLLLELAEAEMTKGNLQAGHTRCRSAFEFARTVGDPVLMAQSALTYGSAIVVARVDAFLVQALEECLTVLPERDVALRARVTARLAAALQPAPRPTEPVVMARRAIEMARSTEDEQVIFEVLRSSVSAMMDFTPAAERVPLNREYGELARRFGNIPERFRAVLRLVMDACELGDRTMLDESVRAAEQLAERIGLPHYEWRVASLKVLIATIEGRFAQALTALEEAGKLAEEAGDDSARMTLPLQRLMVLIQWTEAPASDVVDFAGDLETALAMFPDAELYVRPLYLAFRDPDRISAMLNDALVDRILQGGDRFTQCLLGELSVRQRNLPVVERVYRQLLPFADQCATLGLMGSSWYGPVAHSLALMAEALGDVPDARLHADSALEICQRMRAIPATAYAHATAARLAERSGDHAAAASHADQARTLQSRFALKPERSLSDPETTPGPPDDAGTQASTVDSEEPAAIFELTLEGEVWRVRFDGDEAVLRRSKGLEILARLVDAPDREFHVLDLASPAGVIDPGNSGPALDAQARSAYQARIRALTDILEEAETLGDIESADTAREEIEFIGRELSRAFGLGGRSRSGTAATERARVNVQRRLRDAIRKVGSQIPEAARYLENTIKTGSYCSYRPH